MCYFDPPRIEVRLVCGRSWPGPGGGLELTAAHCSGVSPESISVERDLAEAGRCALSRCALVLDQAVACSTPPTDVVRRRTAVGPVVLLLREDGTVVLRCLASCVVPNTQMGVGGALNQSFNPSITLQTQRNARITQRDNNMGAGNESGTRNGVSNGGMKLAA